MPFVMIRFVLLWKLDTPVEVERGQTFQVVVFSPREVHLLSRTDQAPFCSGAAFC